MKSADCTWSKALVGVCTRCHEAIDQKSLAQAGNAGENLKDFLKASLRTKGHAGAIRVVNTSCLGLCPAGEQAVVVHEHKQIGKMLVVHPENDRGELLEQLAHLADS